MKKRLDIVSIGSVCSNCEMRLQLGRTYVRYALWVFVFFGLYYVFTGERLGDWLILQVFIVLLLLGALIDLVKLPVVVIEEGGGTEPLNNRQVQSPSEGNASTLAASMISLALLILCCAILAAYFSVSIANT